MIIKLFFLLYPAINKFPPKHISLQDSSIWFYVNVNFIYSMYIVHCTTCTVKILYITNNKKKPILMYKIIIFCLKLWWKGEIKYSIIKFSYTVLVHEDLIVASDETLCFQMWWYLMMTQLKTIYSCYIRCSTYKKIKIFLNLF